MSKLSVAVSRPLPPPSAETQQAEHAERGQDEGGRLGNLGGLEGKPVHAKLVEAPEGNAVLVFVAFDPQESFTALPSGASKPVSVTISWG